MKANNLRLGTLAGLYMSVCLPMSALAQTAPSETWNIAAITTTGTNAAGTTNTGSSTLYGSMDAPTITNAVTGASISGASVGASSSVSASMVTDGTATPSSTANYNTVNLVTTNGSVATPGTPAVASTDGAVSAYGDLTSPQIDNGTANSVSLAAVGASGSLSVSSLSAGTSASTQEVTFDQQIDVASTNYGSVVVGGGNNNDVAVTDANIATGYKNAISVAGVGASSSASVNIVATGGSTPAETINIGTASDGTTPVAVNLTATNGEAGVGGVNGDVTVDASVTDGTIAYGIGNSISVAAVGASTSLGVSSLADGAGTDPSTDVNVGTANLTATNNGTVIVTGALDSTSILDGVGNSISMAAVGASASVSIDSTATDQAAPNLTVDTGALTITANNNGVVTNNGTINFTSTPSAAHIEGGIGNSISLAAVGASGSLGVSNLSSGDNTTASTNTVTVGDATITANNSGAVTMADNGGIDLGYIEESSSSSTPTINASISAAAVGASTSVSSSSISDDGASPDGSVTIGNTILSSVNTGAVTANGNVQQPEIVDGTSGSISLAAVGASSSASFGTIQWDGGQNSTDVTAGTVSLTADSSTGAVSTTSYISESEIYGGVGNSISVAAVGASTSLSVSNVSVGSVGASPNTVYSGGDAVTTVGAATLTSTNSSSVTTTASMGATGWDVASDPNEFSNPEISGGSLGSISVAAVGASGSTSYSSTTATGGIGSQTYNIAAADMTITNSGTVTVNSNIFGAEISGGLNNSISMAAVGASASSSLSFITR